MEKFELQSGSGVSVDVNMLMFADISEVAQKQALEYKGVSSPAECDWDVMPVAYICGSKDEMSMEDRDMEALLQIGLYRFVA